MENTRKHDDPEVLSLLALSNLRGVGFETLKSIARDHISFTSFFYGKGESVAPTRETLNPNHSRILDILKSREDRLTALDGARRNLEYLTRNRISVLFPDHSRYPRQLLDLHDAPPWLFVEGNVDVLSKSAITAVGSRKISDDGKWLSSYLGYSLPELNAVTVSGLADGVDQIVHRSSLNAGLPTVAVLGTGILTDYPQGSQDLRRRIVDAGGAVMTEYLPRDTFSAKNFVRRNRIQAALGRVVLPVEWGVKSGTAHTVKFAFDLNRPLVFVRTPTQPRFDWVPGEYRQIGQFFTLPQDHGDFISTLADQLDYKETQRMLI